MKDKKQIFYKSQIEEKKVYFNKTSNACILMLPKEYINTHVYCIFGTKDWEDEEKICINVTEIILKRITMTESRTGGVRGRAYMPKKYIDKSYWIMPQDNESLNDIIMEFDDKDLLKRKVKQGKGGGTIMLPPEYLDKKIRVIFKKKW